MSTPVSEEIITPISRHEECLAYSHQLQPDSACWAYLRGRGLDDAMIRRAHLGVIAEPLSDAACSFVGALVVPYWFHSPEGARILHAKVRLPEGGSLRYATLSPSDHPGGSVHLYRGGQLLKPGPIVLCEGEFDAIIATQLGLPAIGVPGVNAFDGGWLTWFKRRDVTIAFDGDEAGNTAASRIAGQLEKVRAKVRVVDLGGHDINSYYLKHGPVQTFALLESGQGSDGGQASG